MSRSRSLNSPAPAPGPRSSTAKLTWLIQAAHVPDRGAGGGMVRYVVELVAALHRRDDVDVHVVASANAAGWWRQRLNDHQVHTVADLPAALAGLRDMSRWGTPDVPRFDVVHGAKHLIPLRIRSGVQILTVHDMLPLDRPFDFGVAKRLLLRRPYLDSLRRADLLLCVSESTRERLLSYVPEVAGRSRVVPLAPATSLAHVEPLPVPGLIPGRFILSVGDDSPRKNLATLLTAWQRVRPVIPDAVLALAGPAGWGVTAGTDGTQPGVVKLGHINDAQLRWCYQNAAAVAVPSLLEGFGLPAAEARMWGTPVITSEDPALAEASNRSATVVTAGTPDSWAQAMLTSILATSAGPQHLGGGKLRNWDDVAAESVRAVREVSIQRPKAASHVS